jgi:murein DD-endopeptidase MepM/ murein hydrolase activator NlpD
VTVAGTYVTSPGWQGKRVLTAGKYYRSGTYHGSWDVAMPNWTPLYAIEDGVILDLYTLAHNNVPGERIWSGKSSNWRMLGVVRPNGDKVTYFYQHLSPGSAGISRGQRVRKGQIIGYSGNSGNSSGPHLHLTAIRGWRWGWERYVYLRDRTQAIYPPSLAWESPWASGDVYLSRLRFGVQGSDSVRRLQYRLRRMYPRLSRLIGLRVTGTYDAKTDRLVRRHQRRTFGESDPKGKSFVGPKQAARIFGSAYRIVK